MYFKQNNYGNKIFKFILKKFKLVNQMNSHTYIDQISFKIINNNYHMLKNQENNMMVKIKI